MNSSKSECAVVCAQIASAVGDLKTNQQRILSAISQAKQAGKTTLLFPELALTGAPLGDLLTRPAFLAAVKQSLADIVAATTGITIVLGLPEASNGQLFNAAVVIREQKVIAKAYKQLLTRGGIADDTRHFTAGNQPLCQYQADGQNIAVVIGQDVAHAPWQAALKQADIVLNLRAQPFSVQQTEQNFAEIAAELNAPVYVANMAGAQDELVFAGGSAIYNANGKLHCQAPLFIPHLLSLDAPQPKAQAAAETPMARLYQALVIAVRDYAQHNGFKRIVLGASGGIDSALVMAIAADAIGGENVWAVAMPSQYTAAMSNDDAQAEAQALGARYEQIAIEPIFDQFLQALEPAFAGQPVNTAEENLQARTRGTLLMALSNKFGHLLLVPSNKSEMAVGYSTLYGDMNGGFAPLKDIYKTQVYSLAKYRNSLSPVIPERVITRPPSAELRPDQVDSDSLPDYDTLDAIIYAYLEQGRTAAEIIKQGYAAEDVNRVIRLIRINEYKRQQAAPGPQVSAVGFGSGRRFPITGHWQDY